MPDVTLPDGMGAYTGILDTEGHTVGLPRDKLSPCEGPIGLFQIQQLSRW